MVYDKVEIRGSFNGGWTKRSVRSCRKECVKHDVKVTAPSTEHTVDYVTPLSVCKSTVTRVLPLTYVHPSRDHLTE